jgi:hypothetical protein
MAYQKKFHSIHYFFLKPAYLLKKKLINQLYFDISEAIFQAKPNNNLNLILQYQN